ncbi:ATP-binding protein [Thalassococcus profundi]|jgi:predicted AAA+ superfamily ATPase|uniref:ATP-binding protein n=1 Tax=Thalassococcus profundi TaxID=2282382 RepID=A0A369TFA3_9RHOB|nr:ATP-binding protein [Thalassococcus profundi]RDD64051.1 ATP-binding protein [Thalassococcus profundi]|tara:strand:+ start:666 stop:1829 length:1164 start_codon:yes stop_codon:yes gene_type:complete
MYKRQTHHFVQSALESQAAVVLLGPRQVGKTTLALDIASEQPSVYLDLERDADRQILTEPDLYLDEQAGKLVILDEVQQMPGLFKSLRGQIDQRRRAGFRAGQFLLLGSASNVLLQQSAESLAGRVRYIEMPPLQLTEVGADQLNALWLRGGFPDSFMASSDQASMDWRLDFLRTYLERDIPALGPRIPAATLRRFWTMLAHVQGGLLNAAALAEGLGVSGQTIGRYLDLLVDLMLVRRLQPWHENVGKRLVKSPKVYVRDSGVVHALLSIGTIEGLLGHPVVGGSWEGLCIEALLAAAPTGTEPFFYRTSAGAELDLVLRLPGGDIWAVEIKRTTAPKVSRGFYVGAEDIKASRKLLIYAGEHDVPVAEGVRAVPLEQGIGLLRAL